MDIVDPRFPFTLPELTPSAIVDIAVVAFLLYQFFMIIRGRRAVHIVAGVLILVGLYVVSVMIGLGLLSRFLETVAPYTVFALIVMFQSDIRRLLARIGRRRWFSAGPGMSKHEFAEEIRLTLHRLSQQKTGALIVLERDIGLRTFVESGVPVDAHLSRDLLLAIFEPGGALHDGAVIIQGDRIAAAACFLPLSMNPRLVTTLGTRHRAAIGVTEETDCLSLIVSEETGAISIAASAAIRQNVTLDEAEEALARHFRRGKRQEAATHGETSAAANDARWKEAGPS